ncbi:UNVERIFIED_ORG: uncharacterized protein DUF3558 [Nocardia globerula]|uniref:Uncharacterized protein DUF3558 n=1 Tax=Nocardia globerula TaxID=1818 RepID=A0A652YWT9_NOCGL|nr:DUF3558 domain-containing protein [Rhodococcus globerulus]NMD59478.1 DUF3558 domain-containing protein [Nocardia globerula]PVX64450.1 uncharacterized protein DUF3558 [Rhodococcus globerulus]
MPRRRALSFSTPLVVAAAVLVSATGCGADDGTAEQSTGSAPTAQAATDPGPMFAECGSVTDEEVVAAFGLAFTDVTRNGVGCEWTVAGSLGPSVAFSWYRGSPIGRERAGSDLLGRPAADITIEGHSGFIASREGVLCELGISFGGDFVHWSVNYGSANSGLVAPPADPCVVGKSLMELTVSRAQ